ncbi:hypothetical protein GCM10020220_023650 [Nonomuraea rubra]
MTAGWAGGDLGDPAGRDRGPAVRTGAADDDMAILIMSASSCLSALRRVKYNERGKK